MAHSSAISFHSLPSSVTDQILDRLPLADCIRLSATSCAARAMCTREAVQHHFGTAECTAHPRREILHLLIQTTLHHAGSGSTVPLNHKISNIQEHLTHRRQVSIRDLPARTVRASQILKALMNIKQPRRLSLCLMLLPDVATRGLSPSRSFPDHLCSLQHLTSVTLLIDEPRTNSYFMEYGVKQDLCMVAKSLEAICLSAAPVHTVVAGGLRYLNTADLSRSLSLMAIYKPSVRSLHLVRLENLTGSDLMLLTSNTPERTSWCGQEPDDVPLERLSNSMPSSMPSESGLEPLAAHIQQASQASHVRSSREKMSTGGSSSGNSSSTGCVAHNLTCFSMMECSKVTDQELAEFFTHTKNLEFVSLVPDDYVTSVGMSAHRTVAVPGQDPHPLGHPVGIEALAALAAAAPKKLKHLYLSEELSPSSFGDAALAPVLAVATGLEELCLNIPVSDQILTLLARNCKLLQKLMLPASNVSDTALAPVFEACSHLHSVTLCGSPYFGSRGINGSFLKPLFKRSKALTNISLDCMHNVTAGKLSSMLLSFSQSGGLQKETSNGSTHASAPAWLRSAAGERSTIDSLEGLLYGSEGSGTFISQLESLRLPGTDSFGMDPAAEAAAAAALAGFASLDPPAGVAVAGPSMYAQGRGSSSTHAARDSRGVGERWWADVVSSDERSSAGRGTAYGSVARRSSLCSALGQLTKHPDGTWVPTELPTSLPAPPKEHAYEEHELGAPPPVVAAVPVMRQPRCTEASTSSWGLSGNVSSVCMLGMPTAVVPDSEWLLVSLTTLVLDHMPKLREGGPDSLCALLAHAPNLCSLSLQGYDGSINCVLEGAVRFCPQLSSVGVGGCRHLSDQGLLQLCSLTPQLNALNMQSCVLVTPQAIQKVLLYHQNTLEIVDLWGTRACGHETAAFLTSGRLRRVNIGGTFFGESAQHEGLLRRVMNDIPAASGTEVTTIAQSALLSHRVMFAPRFHELLAMSSLVDV